MSPKRIRQQNKTVTIYNSKTVNGNNKKDKKPTICLEQNRNSIDNWNFYFKSNELDDIKSAIKCKDLTGIPLVIGAAVLNKKDVLLNLIKQGYNINETDKNNYSALCWAVKLKQLDIVEFLLCNKADPLLKPVNGDDVLNMALGSNAWDEESFIILFNILKIHGHVDINASNKNCLSVLHLTIRREWNHFFDILLSNEVNINTATPCGVTPLMLASYRHDIGIVNRLIAKGASVTCKNSDGFTALCYAFSSAIIKRLEPPFPVVDKLQIELAKNNIYLLDYLKDKLGTILEPKKVNGDQISVEEMLQYILTFVICNIKGGFEVLWNDFGIISFIKQLLVKRMEDFEQLKFPLLVLNIVSKNISSSYDLYEVVPTFINSGCLDICLEIVEKGIGDELTILAFYPMFELFCKFSPESASSWIEGKYEYLQKSLSVFIKALKKTEMLEEDFKLVLEKVEDFKRIFIRSSVEEMPEKIMLGSKPSSKKNKRRAKSQKAKITKTKSLDLTEYLTYQFTEEELIYKENMCVDAIKTSVGISEDDKKVLERSWKEVIQELPFRQCPYLKLQEDGSDKLDIDLTIKYLEGLLNLIVSKYKIIWELDRPFECDNENDVLGFTMPIEENAQFQQTIEREKLRIVHKEFYNLTNNIRKYHGNDPEAIHALLKELEKLLLTHSIRGKNILEEVTAMETIKINVTMPVDFANVLPKYMEDVLNELVDQIEEVNINVLEHVTAEKTVEESGMGDYVYFDESLIVKNCECESPPINKNDYYHLASSILNICEENEDVKTCCKKGCMKGLDIGNNKQSRWCSMMRSLEMMDDCQCFFNGKIRISNSEKRKSHILAPSGNFAVLEMGLGSDNEPLAVKFLAKNDTFAPLLKMLIDPIADLRHKNILHYYICAYDSNYLVIATPLCEYNLGQYVLKMRHSQMRICKVNIIRQMLAGLMFLHDHDEPVVHGSLKPSNVLVDCDGVVRIAEFGIHKAFLNEKKLPESTIIWFASECYKLYRQNAPLECTCSSDIQVAGMLVHFAMNHGSHPFGKDVPDILKNLEKAAPQIIAKDMELYDLLTWMLLGEPGDRPTIHQVLSHIFFWSDKKKWRYVLACAGLGSKIPLDVEALHGSLDKTAHKENISGNCWMLTAKKHYPQASFVENKDTPSGLLKFIRAVVENNIMLQDDGEKSLNCFILDSFPYFALSLYRMIENTEWSDHRVFMPFHNVVDY